MSLSFCVLASGSQGNCTLLALDDGPPYALIDCGLSPRATAARLAPLGVAIDEITDVLLTHLDGDHFAAGWRKIILKHRIDVHVHDRHRARALRLGLPGSRLALFREPFPLAGAAVEPVMLAHDTLGAVGFVVERAKARLGFATDVGRVTRGLTGRFVRLDALAIESNYDPALQRASPRPAALKRRITGGTGHLSNEQSLSAVLQIDAASRLSHVVALHLSQQCNAARIVEDLYARKARHLLGALTIASQRHPTPMLRVRAGARRPRTGEQLALAFGNP